MRDLIKEKETKRRWREKNKKHISDYNKQYYQDNIKNNREEWNKYQREYYRKRKAKLQKIIGKKCVLCGSTNDIVFHEIHGQQHWEVSYIRNFKYILSHKEDFVSMCRTCHSILHSSARVKINLKILKHYLTLLLGSNRSNSCLTFI